MEKRIEYQGMTSQPSDYVCPDGDMKLAVNAECRDGGWKAVREVKEKEESCSNIKGGVPLYIHGYAKKLYNIIYYKDEKLFHKKYNEESGRAFELENIKLENITKIHSFGLLLCLIIKDKILIFRYCHDVDYYEEFSSESLGINFNVFCERYFENADTEKQQPDLLYPNFVYYINYPDTTAELPFLRNPYSSKNTATKTFKNDVNVRTFKDKLFSKLSIKHGELIENKIFMFPVIMKIALEMYDGSIAYLSNDILLFPIGSTVIDNNRTTIYSDTFNNKLNGHNEVDIANAVLNNRGFAFEAYKIKVELNDIYKFVYSTDFIKGVSFYLSKEIYTVDTVDVDLNLYIGLFNGGLNEGNQTLKKFAWEEKDGLDSITNQWNDNSNAIRPNPSFKYKNLYEQIDDISSFYKVKSFSLKELIDMAGQEIYLFDDEDDIKNYIEFETLSLSDNSFSNMRAYGAYHYNSRLLLYDTTEVCNYKINKTVFPSIINRLRDTDLPEQLKYENLYPECNGIVVSLKDSVKGLYNVEIMSEEKRMPVLIDIFNKNIDEVYIELENGKYAPIEGKLIKSSLRASSFFVNVQYEGSYYYGDYKENHGLNCENHYIVDELNKSAAINSYDVVLSEVNNPFVYKNINKISFSNGTVLSICENSLATSQGQFGQYPLYAFCTDGVYSIGIGTDGTLQNCVPLSYDILTDKHSVGKMEQIVVFATREGIIALSGSERKVLLSADKEADYTYDNDKQKDFITKTVNNVVGITPPQMTDLYTYITTGVRFAFDANHGRLIAFNPAYDYSYIMDAKTNNWSVFYKGFDSVLNIPEQCLLVRKETNEDGETEYNVYDYSSDEVVDIQKSYFITRPFKLDMPDVHKSIQSIIQRGVFCDRKDVQQALYGSNDLYNWTPVWSSKDIYLRGMRGSGYKYYKLAIFIPEFKQDEILHGCSVEFTPRLTNKPR